MAKPTYIGIQSTDYSATTSPKTTGTLTCQAGDLLVAFAIVERNIGDTSTTVDNVSSPTLTWTQIQTVNANAGVYIKVRTAIATGNTSVTFTRNIGTGVAKAWGGSVIALRGCTGVGSSVKSSVSSFGTASLPVLTLTTTQINSAILFITGDLSTETVPGDSTAFRTDAGSVTTLVDEYVQNVIEARVGLSSDSGITGAYTVGLTAPINTYWVAVAIEFKGTSNTVLSVNGLNQVQSLGTVPLNIDISVNSLGQEQTINSPILDIDTAVVVNNLSQAQSLASIALRIHLIVNTLAHGQSLSTVDIYAGTNISPLDVLTVQSIPAVSALSASCTGTGSGPIVTIIAPTGNATTVNPPNSENNFLLEDTSYSGTDLIIGVDSELFMFMVEQAQSLGTVVLTQAHVLAITNIVQAQTTSNISLTQAGALVVQSLGQGQVLGTAILNQDTFIFPVGMGQVQSITSTTLVEQAIITIDTLLQNIELENIEPFQNNFLVLDYTFVEQILSEPAVAPTYVLAVQNISVFQTMYNIGLLTYDGNIIGRLIYVLESEKIIYVLDT